MISIYVLFITAAIEAALGYLVAIERDEAAYADMYNLHNLGSK